MVKKPIEKEKKKKKVIKIHQTTHWKLQRLGVKTESFDDIINKLLDSYSSNDK